MDMFELCQRRSHEAVVFCSDKSTDLRAIIAIHDMTLGPALGGCRIKTYPDIDEALKDVLQLSRAMTYKAAAAGLNLGGGKSVLMLREGQDKTPALLKAFAERINLLGGTYIGAGDVGSDTHDLKIMKQDCKWIVGLAEEDGGLGDSAILTSYGVFMGIKAAVKECLGKNSLAGLSIAVQGGGKVGFELMKHLVGEGMTIFVSEPNPQTAQKIRNRFPMIQIVEADQLYEKDVDIFSPNAIGGLITDEVAGRLKAKILAGGANNPLSGESVAKVLHQRDILYAPDFVINAGGLIMVACEYAGLSFEQAKQRVAQIHDRTLAVFKFAKTQGLFPWEAARQMAVERIEQSRGRRQRSGPVVTPIY
jgi:glutamate dehydrogenase/leucine dehydrogenase